MIHYDDFEEVDIRVGKILEVHHLENARYTTHRLIIDFGEELGKKQSCARVIKYTDEELIGRLVVGVVNLEPRQIGKHMSEVLTLGLPDANGDCVLLEPDKEVPLGGKMF